MLAVIMLSYADNVDLSEVGHCSLRVANSVYHIHLAPEAFDALDVFAGAARISQCLREHGFRTATLDVEHWPDWVSKRLDAPRSSGNPLDLMTPAGFLRLDQELNPDTIEIPAAHGCPRNLYT